MTVVAAFRTCGTPILVGDLLITADANNEENSFLPTSPAAAASLPKDICARIAGTRKKVHLFGGSVAIAWSGSWLAASSVLKALKDFSNGSEVDSNTLTAFFAQQTGWEEDRVSVVLTGWLVKPGLLCFRWNSSWPHEVFFDDRFFDECRSDVL